MLVDYSNLQKLTIFQWQNNLCFAVIKKHLPNQSTLTANVLLFQQFKEKENVRFLSYINPHIINGSDMFNYADKRSYFIKSAKTGNKYMYFFYYYLS